jgi:hypothetical protein
MEDLKSHLKKHWKKYAVVGFFILIAAMAGCATNGNGGYEDCTPYPSPNACYGDDN